MLLQESKILGFSLRSLSIISMNSSILLTSSSGSPPGGAAVSTGAEEDDDDDDDDGVVDGKVVENCDGETVECFL